MTKQPSRIPGAVSSFYFDTKVGKVLTGPVFVPRAVLLACSGAHYTIRASGIGTCDTLKGWRGVVRVQVENLMVLGLVSRCHKKGCD